MNWYKNFLKLSFPIAKISCPFCHTPLLADVKQRTDTLLSDHYGENDEENGVVMTKCENCGKLIDINYHWVKGDFYADATTEPASESDISKDSVVSALA